MFPKYKASLEEEGDHKRKQVNYLLHPCEASKFVPTIQHNMKRKLQEKLKSGIPPLSTYGTRLQVLLLCGFTLFILAFSLKKDVRLHTVAAVNYLGAKKSKSERVPLRFSVSNPDNPSEQHVVLEYYEGDQGSPFVFVAPHSGTVAPSYMPDRQAGFQPTEDDNPYNNDKSFVKSRDFGSDLVALETAERIARETGVAPHVIIVRLARIKADLNRRRDVATQNHPIAGAVWDKFHGYIEQAKAKVKKDHNNRGILFDFHTQSHKPDRIELGYQLSKDQLKAPGLEAFAAHTSIRAMVTASRPLDSLVRGSNSLGQMLVSSGFAATPSEKYANPQEHFSQYFNGGYITARHGSKTGGNFSAIQLECSPASVNKPSYKNGQRPQFVEALARIIPAYTNTYVLP